MDVQERDPLSQAGQDKENLHGRKLLGSSTENKMIRGPKMEPKDELRQFCKGHWGGAVRNVERELKESKVMIDKRKRKSREVQQC